MPETDSAVPAPGWRGTLVLGLAVLALVHSVLIALWLAPSGPVRQGVGSSELGGYVDPYFRQSWSNLQPSAQKVDETFRVRARIRGADGVLTTEWADVTAEQTADLRNNLAPNRSLLSARRLATNLNAAMFALEEAGQDVVSGDYAERQISELREALGDVGAPDGTVRAYIVDDTMATRFASLYAQARWDGEVVEVQYRTGYRTVPDRGAGARLQDLEFTWFDFGWRKGYRGPVGARLAFREWVDP